MKLNTFWGLKGYGENSTINDTLAISNFNKSLQYESNLGERKKNNSLIEDCNQRLRNGKKQLNKKTI